MQKQHERVLRDSGQVKEHFKMYKVGRRWLFAGLFTVSLGAGIAFGGQQNAYADAPTETNPATDEVSSQQNNLQGKSVGLGTQTQSTGTTNNMKADTSQTTAQTAVKPVSEDATNAAPESSAQAVPEAAVKTVPTAVAVPTGKGTQTNTNNVQTTNLGDVTDENTIDQAKTAAAAAYAKTGTPQAITAVSADTSTTQVPAPADPTQAVTATVEDATKIYDSTSATPATLNVKLSDNLTAPTGWFVTGNKDEYQVATASGDIDLSKIDQSVGSYDISLSTNGLARLNAVQANQKQNLVVSSADVTGGKLTITKAPVVTGSVAIENTSKLYDNDATTDPTSFKVKVNPGLKAPTDWTVNADGTYTVTIASGDIQANVDSQEAGTYTVNLTAAGLQKLNTSNINYNIVASNVTAGNFQIQNNTKLGIGTVRMRTTDTSLPATVTVSISRHETIPSDWAVNYNNTSTENIVYNVPISYFDTTAVHKSTVNTYPLNLTTTALDNLNAANPNTPIKLINIQPGRLIIADGSVDTPVRNLSNFGGGGGNLNGEILNDGDGATLQLGIFGTSKDKVTNFTNVIVIPVGLAVANVTTDPTNPTKITSYTKSDDPVDVIKSSITQTLATTKTSYTDLTVGQLPDYKGRQAFYFKLGTVDETGDTAKVPINVVVDPDINNVTTGNFGDRTVENDAAILYATDDNAYTDGAYTIDTGGEYPNVPVVANGLGLTNTETISTTYDNPMWAGSYTIKHIPVQDTYNLTDAAGNKIANDVTTSGMVGDAYDPLSVVPEKVTAADGTQYILDQTSTPVEQTFKKNATVPIKPDTTLATGTTYTATYKKVIDTANAANQAKVNNSQMTWKSTMPSTMTVTLPSNLKAPNGWTKTTGSTYTVNTADGDLDLSAVQSPVGSYDVALSKQGLTNLAAANPDYLFDNLINGVGKLTVNSLKIPVTVQDTAGTSLKTVPDIQLGANTSVPGAGADAGVNGYPTSQLKSVTFNYAQNANNTTGVKSATLVANKTDGTITVTTTYYGNKPQSVATMTKEELGGTAPGSGLALQLDDGTMGSGLGFNVTPQISTTQANGMAALTGINVVYNQKAAATVTYVDDDNNGNVVPNTGTTLNGFVDDMLPYTVTIPANYVAANTVTTPANVTLTTDDTDNLVVHLKHVITYGTAQSTRTINYVMQGGDSSKAPTSVVQKIDWKTITDHVTNTSYATPQTIYEGVTAPTIAGYTPDKSSIARDNPGVINPSAIQNTTENVKYTPNQSTTTITFTGLPDGKKPADKTITTTTDEPYTFTDIPTVAGYTPNTTEITGIGTPTGDTKTVTYTADNNAATVTYVDDLTNKVIDTDSINGKTDETGTYNVSVPADYVLAKNQSNAVSYTITPDDSDNFTVHLTHAVVHGTKQTQRVINYVIDNPGADSVPRTSGTVTQTIKWNTSTDKVTNDTVATATGSYQAVTIPIIQGYTATINDQNATQIPNLYPGAMNASDLTDTSVTVNYKPNTVTTNVTVPSNKGNQTVTGVSGTVDNHVQVSVPDLPGYTKDKTTVPATVNPDGTITVDNPNMTGLVTYTPNPQGINVKFVDQDNNLLNNTTLTGVSDGNVDYTPAFAEQQTLLNQGYTLKNGNNNGLAGATKTYDHDDNVTPTYVVVLTKINNVKVTVNLVPSDGNGNPITGITPTTVHNYPGTSVPAPSVPGYTANTPNVTIPGNRDGNVNVIYTPDPQSINVKFVDQDNNPLGNTTLTGVSDGNVDYTPAFAEQQTLLDKGYTLKKGNNNGLASATKTYDRNDNVTPTYVVVLSKINNVKVTASIVPSDGNGNPIPNTTPTTVHDYPDTSVTVPDVPGYSTTTPNVTIPAGRDNIVKVIYTPKTQKINVHFVDDQGTSLGTTILSGPSDSDIDYTPAFQAQQDWINQGYTLKKGNNNGLDSATKAYDHDDNATPTYEVVLTKISNVKVTSDLTPVLSNGDPVPGGQIATVNNYPGTVINNPGISGYTPTTDTTTIPPKNGVVTVVYTPNTVTGTVDVPSNKGNQTVPNTTGKTGDHITVDVPTIPGYTADKTTVPATVNPNGTISVDGPDGKLGDKNYVNYTADPQTITVNFTDENGTPLGTTVLNGQTDGNVDYGAAVTKEQSIINTGYTPKNGLQNGLTGIPATFTSHSQTFTVQLTKIKDVEVDTTLVPSNDQGNPIPNTTPTTVHNYPGTSVTVPNVPGYTATTPNVTIPAGRDNTINVVYTPNTVTTNVDVPSNKGNQTVPNITGKTGDHVAVDIPTVPGYTADKTTVPATVNPDGTITVDGPNSKPGDKNYVNYTANPQSIKVQFIDKDNKNVDLGSVILNGVSDAPVDYSPAFAKEQELLNQGYAPSENDNNGLAGAPKTFNQYGKTPTYVVELSHPEPVEIDKVPTDNVPYANQYTVNFVTPDGTVVGTTTVVGNPGNNFDVTGNVPNGYNLKNNGNGTVEIQKDQNPAQPINVTVVAPSIPSNDTDNGTGVPGGDSTDNGTGTPNDNNGTDKPDNNTTTNDKPDNNTGADKPDSNTTTNDKPDNNTGTGKTNNNTISTGTNNSTAGQSTGSNETSNGSQTGLAHQNNYVKAGQAQQLTSSSVGNLNGSNSDAMKNKNVTLPQTNEQTSSVWAMLGLGIMSMLSLLGFKKKKREDEK